MTGLYLPPDEILGESVNFDLAADFLELTAFLSTDNMALTSDLAVQAGLGGQADEVDGVSEHWDEDIISGTISRIETRQHALDGEYPFALDRNGDTLFCIATDEAVSCGQATYVLCLVLSNLRSLSLVLEGSDFHPDDAEVRQLRNFFQCLATAALAAEIGGEAWSFGFPRPEGTGHVEALESIWARLKDGDVEPQRGASTSPKDGKVDVFAARVPPDGLPAFLLAAAQVATGKGMRDKSLKSQMGVFTSRWFATQPVTEIIPYMIVPFARADDELVDDVRIFGNVLHRLRVPCRVAEAEILSNAGTRIEGFGQLSAVVQWADAYRERARSP